MMDTKNIVATLYIKSGKAVKSANDFTPVGDIRELAQHYNDSGIDKLICYDLSDEGYEHELNLSLIKEINRTLSIKCCGGGNVKRLEDVKKLLYAGCKQVIINGSKPGAIDLCKEAGERFGVEKIVVSLTSMDFIFKTNSEATPILHEYLLMNSELLQGMSDATNMPFVVETQESDVDKLYEILSVDNIRGISGSYFNAMDTDIMELKCRLMERGIRLDNFEPSIGWDEIKTNDQGLVPVIVQDYKTNDVLMLAYMNEEAFYTTLRLGRMTYWSRSRNELWIKGETSGHFQYVKSLDCDCDKDTILAKVSQVGAACHTGSRSCFFNEIVKKPYIEKSPLNILEETYAVIADRKANPKEGSYTNYLFDKGIDKILKKIGEEATEMVIAAKNPGAKELEYELSDFLYHAMVLMVEKGLTWEDVVAELARR